MEHSQFVLSISLYNSIECFNMNRECLILCCTQIQDCVRELLMIFAQTFFVMANEDPEMDDGEDDVEEVRKYEHSTCCKW